MLNLVQDLVGVLTLEVISLSIISKILEVVFFIFLYEHLLVVIPDDQHFKDVHVSEPLEVGDTGVIFLVDLLMMLTNF